MEEVQAAPKKSRLTLPGVAIIGGSLLALNILATAINFSVLNQIRGKQENLHAENASIAENNRAVSTKLANHIAEAQSLFNDTGKRFQAINTDLDRLDQLTRTAAATASEAAKLSADTQTENDRRMAELLAKIPRTTVGAGANTLDDLIISRIASQWKHPSQASAGKRAELLMKMRSDGLITAATVTKSSGDEAFDIALVEAVRAVGSIPELASLDEENFERLYAERRLVYVGDTTN